MSLIRLVQGTCMAHRQINGKRPLTFVHGLP